MDIKPCCRCNEDNYHFHAIDTRFMDGYLFTIECASCGNWEPFKTYWPNVSDKINEDAAKAWNPNNPPTHQ